MVTTVSRSRREKRRKTQAPAAGAEAICGQRLRNQMLDRLERAVVQLRQFTADASHELSTPLSVLKAQAQAARRRRLSISW
jgi:signal transduction histidine kinase